MYNFNRYYEAETVYEAMSLLAGNPHVTVIAGGTDVLLKIQAGKIPGIELLSIRKIKSLANIDKLADGTMVIGPLVTFTQIINDPLIRENIPVLATAASTMGGPQIRNVATIGGNLCNGATSADSAPALFVLNARLHLQSLQGDRVVAIQDFYCGPGQVAIRTGEVLTGIIITPQDYQGFGGHYLKFAVRQAMDIATLGVAIFCKIQGGNILEEVRIGLGVAGPTPLRCAEAESYAKGKPVSAETIKQIGKLAVKSTNARSSWRASKEYREYLVEELTQRAMKVAIINAGGAESA